MNPYIEADAREFGMHVGSSEHRLRLAVIVARSVRRGEGAGTRADLGVIAPRSDDGKVSARTFARMAGLSDHKRVLRYLDAWDRCAETGAVPPSWDLSPGKEVDIDVGVLGTFRLSEPAERVEWVPTEKDYAYIEENLIEFGGGMTARQIMAKLRPGVKAHSSTALDKAIERVRGRRDMTGQSSARSGRQKPWDGKSRTQRQKEVRAGMTRQPRLFKVLNDMGKLTGYIEGLRIEELDLAGLDAWDVSFIHSDLVSLALASDRMLREVQRWLEEGDVRAKIAKLRSVNGRTPEEAKTALALADKLEAKLVRHIGAA